jgi:hypothetical protein
MSWNGTQVQVLAINDFGLVPTSWKIAVTGDFNADGKSDILWTNSNGDTSIWYMTGSMTQLQPAVVDMGIVPPSWIVQRAAAD